MPQGVVHRVAAGSTGTLEADDTAADRTGLRGGRAGSGCLRVRSPLRRGLVHRPHPVRGPCEVPLTAPLPPVKVLDVGRDPPRQTSLGSEPGHQMVGVGVQPLTHRVRQRPRHRRPSSPFASEATRLSADSPSSRAKSAFSNPRAELVLLFPTARTPLRPRQLGLGAVRQRPSTPHQLRLVPRRST